MKIKKRKTTITMETNEVVRIRAPISMGPAWCIDCRRPTMWVSAGEAATMTGSVTRVIARAVDAGNLHARETPDRSLLVCLVSLERWEAD